MARQAEDRDRGLTWSEPRALLNQPKDPAQADRVASILHHLCAACSAHFDKVQQLLTDRAIAYAVRPRLVRGLDYYMRTTFEFVHGSLGAQNSVLGGGRYDGLAEQLGSRVPAPGIGFSIGEDRLVMSLEETAPDAHRHSIDLYIAPLGEPALRHCAALAHEIRRKGAVVELGLDSKLKRALELANKLAARHVLIVGENEMNAQAYTLKNMTTGEQQSVTRQDLLAKF